MPESSAESVDDRCHDEVVALHRFFEDWFNGRFPAPEAAASGGSETDPFDRFRGVLAEGFEIIFPNGQMIGRDAILKSVHDTCGVNLRTGTPIRIWIDGFRSRPIDQGHQLVTYQEWQQTEGAPRGRRVTAVMRRQDEAPNGVEWLHVHEVWLPGTATPSASPGKQ